MVTCVIPSEDPDQWSRWLKATVGWNARHSLILPHMNSQAVQISWAAFFLYNYRTV